MQHQQHQVVYPAKRTGSQKCPTGTLNISRRKKRTREEPAPTALQASKFRRSNTSFANAAIPIASATEGVPVISSSVLDANPFNQHTQFLSTRAPQQSTTAMMRSISSQSTKKGKTTATTTMTQKLVNTINSKRIQTTLIESFNIRNKPAAAAETLEKAGDANKENEVDVMEITGGKTCSTTHPAALGGGANKVCGTGAVHQNSPRHQYLSNTIKKTTPITTAVKTNSLDLFEQNSSLVSVSTTAGHSSRFLDLSDVDEDRRRLNSLVVLSPDRKLLSTRITASSLRYDRASYGQDWVLYHRSREDMFQPWQMALDGKIEKDRLAVIQCYWEAMKTHETTPATIFTAVNNFARLLNSWDRCEFDNPVPSRWALTSFVAYRLAFKTEERPDILWEVSSFWNVFPMFKDWDIDRSDRNVNQVETQALRLLNDVIDAPLAPMFLSQYIQAAGWPSELTEEYHELGLYLISLSTFASVKDTLLRNVVPSKLAAGALALAVKIANNDRGSGQGFVKHLRTCCLSVPNRENIINIEGLWRTPAEGSCICRYEFWPSRLEAYANLSFEEIKPVVRGLSGLLRSRPPESIVLKHFFPIWEENEWQ